MSNLIRHLSLLMPGLSDLCKAAAPQPRCSELEILLTRAECDRCPADIDTLLFQLFGASLPAGSLAPVAAVTHGLDTGELSENWLLRADPVYLRADNDRVLMLGNDFLAISQTEAHALCEELRPLFEEFGAILSAPQSKRWYVQLAQDPQVHWRALSEVRGMDIHHYLPSNSGNQTQARRWRRLFNAVQMALYASPVNAAREARGALPVNSLWFWGGGQLPELAKNAYAQVWSDSPIALGLAKLGRVPRTAAPANASVWLQQAITPGEHLLLLERAPLPVLVPAPFSDEPPSSLTALNQHWFVPLLAALKSRELSSLNLYGGDGQVFRITNAAALRWWQRPRALLGFFR